MESDLGKVAKYEKCNNNG